MCDRYTTMLDGVFELLVAPDMVHFKPTISLEQFDNGATVNVCIIHTLRLDVNEKVVSRALC
jgi:hypothetical protein